MKINVEYTVSDEQVKRLEALLPFYNQFIGIKDWTIKEVLQSIMVNGSADAINSRLHYQEQMIVAIDIGTDRESMSNKYLKKEGG